MAKKKMIVAKYCSCYLASDFPVLLLSGDYWKISNTQNKDFHFHNCLELGVCHSESGYMELIGRKEPLFFKEGDIICVPRNIPHTVYSSPNTESQWSYLFVDTSELFRNILPSMFREIDLSVSEYQEYKYILSHDRYPQIYQLILAIIKEMEEEKIHYRTSVLGLLISLCIELHRIQSEGGYKMEQVNNRHTIIISPVLDYIENNYAQQININYLADICHLSPTYFRRLFFSIMGTSPLNFLNGTRIKKACNLLRSTEHSILEISEMVGFHSVSSFNRHFMNMMQTTPRNYRNQTMIATENTKKISILEYKDWMYPGNNE